jgi:hypothetical protein
LIQVRSAQAEGVVHNPCSITDEVLITSVTSSQEDLDFANCSVGIILCFQQYCYSWCANMSLLSQLKYASTRQMARNLSMNRRGLTLAFFNTRSWGASTSFSFRGGGAREEQQRAIRVLSIPMHRSLHRLFRGWFGWWALFLSAWFIKLSFFTQLN